MSYSRYQSRSALANYFPLPNEIFMLGLESDEIAVYSYLLFREDRNDLDCHQRRTAAKRQFAIHHSPHTGGSQPPKR